MAPELCELPYDVLGLIVDTYAEMVVIKPTWRRPAKSDFSREPLRSLSQTCKVLNDLCNYYIHEEYKLTIRASPARYGKCIALTEREKSIGFENWDEESIRQRIQRFADRACYVRFLRIEDWGNDTVKPVPENVVPQLVDALEGSTRLYGVKFKAGGPQGVLHSTLCDALAKREIETLKIYGLTPPPEEDKVKPTLSVQDLTLQWRECTVGFLRVRVHAVCAPLSC
jgi:hypothetical protein